MNLNRSGGAINSTGTSAARINLNGTGTQLTVSVTDTIGSLAGTGNVTIAASQTLNVREGASATVSAAAYSGSTSGAGSMVLSGFGGLTVTGNLGHSAGLTISSDATLVLNYGAGSNVLPGTGTLTLQGSNLRIIKNQPAAGILQSVASTSLASGANSISTWSSYSAETATYQANGNAGINLGSILRTVGATLDVTPGAAATTSANTSGILGSFAYATVDGATWAVGNGAATAITGLDASGYSANTFGAGLHTDVSGPSVVGANTSTLRFNTAGATNVSGSMVLSMSGILVTSQVGANTSTISALLSATSNELIVHQYNPFGDLVLSNVGGVNTTLTTAGGGRTIVTNNISGTGALNIGAGYVQFGDGGSTGMFGSGAVVNNGTLGINRNNAVAIGGNISGTGNFEQLGAGTTTLGGTNTFSGRVTVRAGTLQITSTTALGTGAASPLNRWANFTSVNSGGTLEIALSSTGTVAETFNMDGGILAFGGTGAATVSGSVLLSSSSTIHVGNTGSALSHVITGDVVSFVPGTGLTITGVSNSTPSTVVLAPTGTSGARWTNTSINTNGRLQIGNNSRGWIGTGAVANDGYLAFNVNDAHYVVSNTITGAGTLALTRSTSGNTYLTGDLSGFSGTLLVSTTGNVNSVAELGNDTYNLSVGTGDINIISNSVAGTGGIASLRTHFNQDVVMANSITLAPAGDGTNAKNAQFIRAGLGSLTLSGTINLGVTNATPGTQRNLIQTEGGGKLVLAAALNGSIANSLLNIVNNGIVIIGGSLDQTYNGVLSGNNVWVFQNSGITTLSGANTFDTASTYIQKGTVNLTGGAAIADNNDMHVLRGATLNVQQTETVGSLYSEKGATVNISDGSTLTIDDTASHFFAGSFGGQGNLNIGANTDNQTTYFALYGANSASGILNIGGTGGGTGRLGGIQTPNLTNAIGSFSTINLGVGAGGFIEYIGSGETFTNNINLIGAGSATTNRITANGNGGLELSGNLALSGGNSTLQLTGQTGGYFNPIKNIVSGSITQGAGTTLTLIVNPKVADDDRYGLTGRWALTNPNNNFSGSITVNVGMLEIGGALGAGGSVATSQLGALNVARVIDLGTFDFNGRRYDMFGNGDQITQGGASQGTNTLAPNSGSIGTLIFNSTDTTTFTLPSTISLTQSFSSTTNPGAGQIINDGLGAVVIQGNLTAGASGSRAWILDGTYNGINIISGAISDTSTTGTGDVVGLTKEGSTTWRLSGSNTYEGTTTVTNGVLQLSGGNAIFDSGLVNVSAAGGDGVFSGTARLQVMTSETIGRLQGAIGSEVLIDAGQTLTLSSGTGDTFSGVITGSGNFTRAIASGTTSPTTVLANKNTYTGVTTLGPTGGTAANAQITVYHLANGGSASGIGASSNAAANLVFTGSGANGGILNWAGFTNQSTDRLFTMGGTGTAAARINANGALVGTSQAALTFSNTGAIAFTGSGTRTLILGGAGVADNTFRPQITDGTGGATSLIKTDAGMWVLNPGASGNTYTGGTTITGGTLSIFAGNALGTNTITINGGAGTGLEVRSGITLTNAVTNSTTDGGMGFTSGSSVFSGLITLSAQTRLSVYAGASVNFSNASSALTGAGTLLKFGDGTLILSGTNGAGWTGATTVRDGTLQLEYGTNNSSKLSDAGVLTLGGIGALTTVGVDTSVAGQTNVYGQGGGTINLSGGSHIEITGSTTVDTGSNSVIRSSGTSVLRMNAISRTVGGTIDFGAASIADTDTTNTNGIIGVGYATVGKTNWATNSTNGADGAIVAYTAYGVDTYGATTNVDVTSYSGVGTAANTLRFNNTSGGTLTLSGTFAMTGSGLLVTPNVTGGNVIITGGAIQNAATTAGLEALLIHQHSTSRALQIDSVIQNNTGSQVLTKSGAGKLFLNALNTFTGAVNLSEGEIQVGGTAAAPNTPTNAYLGGYNASPQGNVLNMAIGTTLRFLTTNTAVYNTGTITGDGSIILASGNQGVILFDDDNTNYYGEIVLSGGTIQVGLNNNALGNVRGVLAVNNSVNFNFNDARTITKVTTYSEGTVLNITNTAVGGTFAGKQSFDNTTTGGLTFNVAAPTVAGTVGLNITGVVYGSNGFTKTGNGILQISGTNFGDVYDGFTSANKTATLQGQVQVNGGVLYVGGNRALGAFGVGNETIAASGASIDLRGQSLNLGDDSDTSREIFKIQGTGFNNTGALRNSTGTGVVSFLTLDGSATINSGGTANGSALQIATFDSNLNNGNSVSSYAFTRNQPVIAGNGFDLTFIGGRSATDNIVLADPTFSSALNSLVIREGGTRIVKEIAVQTAFDGLKAADFTNGLEIGYGGPTTADLTGTIAGTGANVGARLYFLNLTNLHNTVNITMNGALAAANNGLNSITVDFSNIPDSSTYLDGDLILSGDAMRNLLISDSTGNYTVAEQGNLTVAPYSKMIVGGRITGDGGFTKLGSGEVRLTTANDFTGDLNVLRLGTSAAPWETHTYRLNGVDYTTQGAAEGWGEWSLTLNGDGTLSNVGTINLQRRGMLTLDNTSRLDNTSNTSGHNMNNRINDNAIVNMQNGWLRLNGGGDVNNTEKVGTVNVKGGTSIIDLYPANNSGTSMTLTITNLNRAAGEGILRIQDLDATSVFRTTLDSSGGESVRVAVTNLNALQIGGTGGVNTTNRKIVVGVLGGIIPMGLDTDLRILGMNNGNVSDLWNQQRNLQFLTGSHFMTYDNGYLRPLDDDEYFSPANGILSLTTPANQNVNLNDVYSIVKENMSINALRFGPLSDNDGSGGAVNSETTLTSLTDHYALNLMVDGTLTINSGMISSGYFTKGNTSNSATVILGGALDFAGQEAIINNQNGYYNLTAGVISTGNFEIRSAITNANGLHKTGLAQVVLDGVNTYTGVTTISDGTLFLRNGRSALGAGGAGNGVLVVGNGSLNSGNGIVVGSPTAREDIYIGILNGDNQVMRVDNDVTVWYSNVTLDNVDVAGQTLFTPRVRTDNSATSIIYGNIGGGNSAVVGDVTQLDSRRLSFNSAGNNVFIVRGQFGDKLDANGNAIPIADPISALPTLAGTRTNENDVLRVNLGGGSLETNFIFDRQYNAAGRLEMEQGLLLVNYDPAASGNDGFGFWTDTALSKIPNADSTTTSFATNGGTTHQGFILTQGSGGTANNNGNAGVFLMRDGQVFNMASWTMGGTGAKYIGGLNQTGTVYFGNGTGNLTFAGATAQLYAADGGTVVFNQRFTGNVGTAPSSFGFVKNGRGTIELRNTSSTSASDASFVLAGGTLVLNHTAATSVALVGSLNARMDGGTLISIASPLVNTTEAIATNDAADRVLNYSTGGTEVVARTANTGTARNMVINMGNGNANNTTSNFTRSLGASGNLVEDSLAGGTAQITLNFNVSSTAAAKDTVIPWLTYGLASRTATDFATVASGSGNDVRAFSTIRAAGDVNNNVATWTASGNISENGGAGFSGTLGGPLSLTTLRFDANSDSIVNLGGNVLTIAAPALAQSASAILVSSNVGAANKTLTGTGGAALTASGASSELIIHQYSTGNFNINVPITGSINLQIAGPSTTNASTIGTSGVVVLNGANTYNGQTFINGAILSISDPSQLGTNPGSLTANRIVMNGGTLRYTGTGLATLANRGLTFNGNGGTVDVMDGSGELFATIASAAQFRGDLIKVGAGTLTLFGASGANNASFQGLIDVRQGTLRLNGNVGNAAVGTSTILGTNNSYADGTIFRNGTNLAIQMGNGNDSGEWLIDEWLTFEGNNYVSVGTINTQTGNVSTTPGFADANNERPVNLNGVITLNGAVTFDVVSGQTLRLNNNNGGGTLYTTGAGDMIKDGQGTMILTTNNHDFMGNIVVRQGRLTGIGQADVFGRGYVNGKSITLGDSSRQGLVEFTLTSENIQGQILEINHSLNVVYNPVQTKRLLFETFANSSIINMNGDITLNDNLQVYINDGAENGGSQNYVNFNGRLKDGVTTSGNLLLTSDDTGGANDNTTGRPYNFLVLNGDNSLWTGDVRISTNTSYDQDQTAILRLGHVNALTAANDVDMGYNSMLQVGGGQRTIGSLSTNGGVGPFIGDAGTMGASSNGSTEIIENAADTEGTLTINQATPTAVEVLWDAFFRNGTMNSLFFAPGTNTHQPSAALNVVKAGNGWATMTLDNDYSGTTTVVKGTLQVGLNGVGDTGSVRTATTPGLTAAVGTTVAGTGVIQGRTTINGNLKPGDQAGLLMGTLTVNGNLTLGATSVTTLQIQRASYTASNAPGYGDPNYASWLTNLVTDPLYSHLLNDPVTTSQHDQLRINGTLTTTAGNKIVLVNNGYTPSAGDIFNLIDWVGALQGNGAFNVGGTGLNGGNFRTGTESGFELDLFELGSNYRWDVSLFNSFGVVVVAAPEPGRVLLLLLGCLAMFYRRRRR